MVTRLPWIANADGPSAQGDTPAEALALFALIRDHPQQRRASMTLHPVLCRVAQAHAADQAAHNYFGHVNLAGAGPNARVRAAGYPLPDWYNQADEANDVESLAAGIARARRV